MPMRSRRTGGRSIEPSSRWWVSMIAATTRGSARPEPLSVWTSSGSGAGLRAVADGHPARLVVAEVRARADLEPALHARRPDLQVVLLGLHEAHVAASPSAGRDRRGRVAAGASRRSAASHRAPPRESSGRSKKTISTLSNWWTRRIPRVSLPAAPGLPAEAGRIGRVPDRQLGGLEDLVAVEVGDRDLGRRDQVQVVARDDVHLVFLVRDLAGADAPTPC